MAGLIAGDLAENTAMPHDPGGGFWSRPLVFQPTRWSAAVFGRGGRDALHAVGQAGLEVAGLGLLAQVYRAVLRLVAHVVEEVFHALGLDTQRLGFGPDLGVAGEAGAFGAFLGLFAQ